MDIKASLTRKIGPLPMWAWGGIAIGAIIIYSAIAKKSTDTTAATDSTGGTGGAASYGDANTQDTATAADTARPRSDSSGSYTGSASTSGQDSGLAYDPGAWSTVPDQVPQTEAPDWVTALINGFQNQQPYAPSGSDVGVAPTGAIPAPIGSGQRPTVPQPKKPAKPASVKPVRQVHASPTKAKQVVYAPVKSTPKPVAKKPASVFAGIKSVGSVVIVPKGRPAPPKPAPKPPVKKPVAKAVARKR